MKKTVVSFLLFALPAACHAVPLEPWFGNVYEFEFDADYSYSRFRKVDHAKPQLSHPFNANALFLGVGMTASEWWDANIEFELADTTSNEPSFRSGALQIRHLWLDDILGDFASLSSGVLMRGVTHYSLKDLSCPYHGEFDIELNSAIGKEWSKWAFWRWRTFAFAALGIANRGAGWAKAYVAVQGNHRDVHQYEFFVDGYFGFGSHTTVNTRHFHGYGSIDHQSIDVGVRYRYEMRLWGTWSVAYSYRPYASSYPAHVNCLMLSYHLPFSLF